MRVIIAGSRPTELVRKHPRLLSQWYQQHTQTVKSAILDSGFQITEVVSGKAKGFDTLGEGWANDNRIPIESFPADWAKLGYRAGPHRNGLMAEYAEALIAITYGTRGTADMIRKMIALHKPVFVLDLRPDSPAKTLPNHQANRPHGGAYPARLRSSGELGAQRRKPEAPRG